MEDLNESVEQMVSALRELIDSGMFKRLFESTMKAVAALGELDAEQQREVCQRIEAERYKEQA